MNMSYITDKIVPVSVLFFIFTLCSTPVMSDDTSYSGIVTTPSGNQVTVKVTLQPPFQVGKKSVIVDYGEKRSCKCNGEFVSANDSIKTFNLYSDGYSGFCKKLTSLELIQKKADKNMVIFKAISGAEVIDSTILKLEKK